MLVIAGILLLLAVLFLVPLAGIVLLLIHAGASAGLGTGVVVAYTLVWAVLVEHNWDRFDPAARRREARD